MYVVLLANNMNYDIDALPCKDAQAAQDKLREVFLKDLGNRGIQLGEDGYPDFPAEANELEFEYDSVRASYTKQAYSIYADDSLTYGKIAQIPGTYSAVDPNAHYLRVDLVRIRPSEGEAWSDRYLFSLSEQEAALDLANYKTAKNLLLARVQRALATAEGLQSVYRSSYDFNWGDAVMDVLDSISLPVEVQAEMDDVPASHLHQITLVVEQDELIAPSAVPVTRRFHVGEERTDVEGTLNMVEGCISVSEDCRLDADSAKPDEIIFSDNGAVPFGWDLSIDFA